MASHPYGLRSRFNSPGVSVKITPSNSPFPKTGSRSPRKPQNGATLTLSHVIGTTTSSPSGFSCHAPSNTFAYCAGCAVVLAKVDSDGQVTQRFFKARPTASCINPIISFYDATTPTASPSPKRRSILPGRMKGPLVTPTGSPIRARADDGDGQTWTARERIKAATSVSLSPNGRFLALGETGYNPRVLLFSTAEDAPLDVPLSIMSEHSFGVRAVAFSPDSRYLASLGDINDGFLFIWAVNIKTGSVRLHSTNKCTTNICQMIWCGSSLLTVGTRHVKIWRIAEPSKQPQVRRTRLRSEDEVLTSPAPIPLAGRNCLLGSLVDCTFTCAAAISDEEAFVCTDDGQICFLDNTEGVQELKLVKRINSPIASITTNLGTQEMLLGGEKGRLQIESIETLRRLARPTRSAASAPQSPATNNQSPKIRLSLNPFTKNPRPRRKLIGIGCLSQGVVSVDSESHMQYEAFEVPGLGKQQNKFAAHDDSVQGLEVLPEGNELGTFYTWSRNGVVKFWDSGGKLRRSETIGLEQTSIEEEECSNELAIVHFIQSANLFASGDRFGVLKIVRGTAWTILHEIRAHSAQITDIKSRRVDNGSLIATCGRDRVAQLFRVGENSFELLQTMDDHIGAVNHVLFTKDGTKLLTSSADRTIIIRERIDRNDEGRSMVAYLTSKVVTLKATPISMAFLPDEMDTLAISTMDRYVVKLGISSGSVMDSFKVADPENDDTAVLNSVCLSAPRGDAIPRLLVGYSSTDKSIRVYDFDKNILLTRESGHTEGISDLALLEDSLGDNLAARRTVISTGLDGTIMIWSLTIAPAQPLATPLHELSQGQIALSYEPEDTPVKPSPASLPPMRKILSKLDIAEFTRIDPSTGSPVSLRDPSPARVRRKTSRLTLATNKIPEHEVPVLPPARQSTLSDSRGRVGRIDSPSPPPKLPSPGLKLQRSRTEPPRDVLGSSAAVGPPPRSPSPESHSQPISVPSTPRHNRANNSRLRRPPSVPTDLRAQAMAQGRRKSMGNVHDFGSMGMASEQAARMLRTYRKKLVNVKEEVDLGEVEIELRATLEVVRRKCSGKAREIEQDLGGRGAPAKAATESEMDELAALLGRAAMNDEGLEGEAGRNGVEAQV